MINDENLDKLYSELLSGIELTTNQLNSFGFNSKDLKNLIEMGIIIRVKRELYSLKSADELFCYGKKLVAERDFDKANLFFEKCFELNPNNLGACFQLFLRSIENQDYKRTFELYEILSKSKIVFIFKIIIIIYIFLVLL